MSFLTPSLLPFLLLLLLQQSQLEDAEVASMSTSSEVDEEEGEEEEENEDGEGEGEEEESESELANTRAAFNACKDRVTDAQRKDFGTLLRAKGFLWLATRPSTCGSFSQAGLIAHIDREMTWFAALPQHDWPDNPDIVEAIRQDFCEPHGDRRVELVFIGQGLHQANICTLLDACLVTDQEWAEVESLEDPFAPWSAEHDAWGVDVSM